MEKIKINKQCLVGFIGLFLLVSSCVQKQSDSSQSNNLKGYDMRTGLSPSRLTIAMWDFSWLNMHYPGGAFENYDKAVDELKERGFNTVRIEAFPLIIGKLEQLNQKVTVPSQPEHVWGFTDVDREHAIVEELIEFMQVTKEKGVSVILSTWGFGCKEYPDIHDDYRDRKDYWNAWEKVLNILEDNSLLDHVLYVDLDQEFPHFSPFNKQIELLGNQKVSGTTSEMLAMEAAGRNKDNLKRRDWNEAQMAFVYDLMMESLMNFQGKYPHLRFTYSLTDYWDEIRALNIDLLDVLEVHFWMTQSSRFHSRSLFSKLKKDRGLPDYGDYMTRINSTLNAIEPMMLQELHNRLQYASEWSKEIGAPLVTTEAWGPWWHMDHQDLDWKWLYDWCEKGMRLSSEYGFWGSTPWNFSHPYWENWENVEWYKKVNGYFLEH